MALDTTPITPVNDPNCLDTSNNASKVYPPLGTTTTLANDVGAGEQILRNQTHTLNEIKADLAGDTFTGPVIINDATTNTTALTATGNGTGYGVNGTGGATGGGAIFTAGGGNNIGCYGLGRGTQPGIQGLGGSSGPGGNFTGGGGNAAGITTTGDGSGNGITATGGSSGKGGAFVAGGGNAVGLDATGSGSGSGITCTGGSSGPGITATPGTASTASVPQCGAKVAGYIEITAEDPSNSVNPGADKAIYGLSVCKAYCVVEVGTGGPYTRDDSHNVSSVVDVVTGTYEVDFVRDMGDANYSVTFGVDTVGIGVSCHTKTTGGFRFTTWDTAAKAAVGDTVTVHFQVFGRR